MKGVITIIVAAVAAFCAPSAAFASTAQISGSDLLYTASPGETNTVTVTQSGLFQRVTDSTTPPTPGFDCFAVLGDANSVDCVAASDLVIDTGDMDDSVAISIAIPATI